MISPTYTIELSERNLLTLLHKLRMPNSHRTIMKPIDNNEWAAVVACPDEEVYTCRPPGRVHPGTEQFINIMHSALESYTTKH